MTVPHTQEALLDAHLSLLLGVMTVDGQLSKQELIKCVELISSSFHITHQQVGAMMHPISNYYEGLSSEDRLSHYSAALMFISQNGSGEFKKACYVHYDLLAQADGVSEAEENLLRLVRTEWQLSESLRDDVRKAAFKLGYQTREKAGKWGCAPTLLIIGVLVVSACS